MAKQTFLMLAHDFDPKKHSYSNRYMSEKINGIRAFWDGGITRGMECSLVPFANTAKHSRFLVPPVATGLWSRYAQPINAPEWFLNQLPKIPLDGELNCGIGGFQKTTSIVQSKVNCNEEAWEDVRYAAFDSPPLSVLFCDKIINDANIKKSFEGILDWITKHHLLDKLNNMMYEPIPFYKVTNILKKSLPEIHEDSNHFYLQQIQLPCSDKESNEIVNKMLESITSAGGEGLMVREGHSFYETNRSYSLLKIKKLKHGEGIVIGYRWADKTDLDRSISGKETNKLLGLMGSVRVRLDSGKEFDLSGFTDQERLMVQFNGTVGIINESAAKAFGSEHPGEVVDFTEYRNLDFPIGSKIKFKYTELSDEDVPKVASYLR